MTIGVVDACFIIDWSRYKRRDRISNLFDIIYIHEEVMDQIRSIRAVEFTAQLMRLGVLRIYPWSRIEEEEFTRLRNEVLSNSRIPALERPDLLCLIIARTLEAVLISENIGVHRVVQYHPEYMHLRVWTALEVLENLVYRGAISVNSTDEFLDILKEYEEDTLHKFRSDRVNSVLRRMREWLGS